MRTKQQSVYGQQAAGLNPTAAADFIQEHQRGGSDLWNQLV